MATVQRFEDLRIWQLARELSREVFSLTGTGPFVRDFDLKNQINASSGSVMDNIAEGFGRGSRAEFVQFLGYSMGSLNEVKSQLYRASDREYIDLTTLNALYQKADQLSLMLRSFMAHVKASPYQGYKFKENEPLYQTTETADTPLNT